MENRFNLDLLPTLILTHRKHLAPLLAHAVGGLPQFLDSKGSIHPLGHMDGGVPQEFRSDMETIPPRSHEPKRAPDVVDMNIRDFSLLLYNLLWVLQVGAGLGRFQSGHDPGPNPNQIAQHGDGGIC